MKRNVAYFVALFFFINITLGLLPAAQGCVNPSPPPQYKRLYFSSANSSANASAISSASASAVGNGYGGQGGQGGAGGAGGSVGNVAGINGDFSIKMGSKYFEPPAGISVAAASIQPMFKDGEVEDGNDFSNIWPMVITRDMTLAAIPVDHPVQGFFREIRLFTGVYNFKKSKVYEMNLIPKDPSFKIKRRPVDQVFYLDGWDPQKPFIANYRAALEKGFVFTYIGKITGDPGEDADVISNALMLGSMEAGMDYYAVQKLTKKQAATSTGDSNVLSGDIMKSSGVSQRLDAGTHAQTSHAYVDNMHGFHTVHLVYDPTLASQRLAEIDKIPSIKAATPEEKPFEGKYFYSIFSPYLTLVFDDVVMNDTEDNRQTFSDWGNWVVANWDDVLEHNFVFTIVTQRDERPYTKGSRKYNANLGQNTGDALREELKKLPQVSKFLAERKISDQEWKDRVIFLTGAADHPAIKGAVNEADHQKNRTAHIALLPAVVKTKEPSKNDPWEDDRYKGGGN